MQTITISKSDFDINDQNSRNKFNKKLREISEPFEAIFDFPITKIPAWLFHHTNLVKVTIPNSVTQIGVYAFHDCKLLKEITLPNSITEIEGNAFEYCKSLIEVTIPDSVTEIYSDAFLSCESLKKITMPSSIKFLGSDIFGDCPSLQQIAIQMSKKDFLSNIEGAKEFYNKYKGKIEFINPLSLDVLLSKNNSLESIINIVEER